MRSKYSFVFALFLLAVPFGANAAPQILGLVATTTPVPLTCVGGKCTVEISAVCLQQHRKAPESGTAYTATRQSDITLVVKDKDGVSRTLAVADKVEIKSLRIFTSVAISLPADMVRQLGGNIHQASLSIGPLSSALPIAEAGDPSPLTATEILDVTGPLRSLAEHAIGRDHANLSATRILNQMINRLPGDQAFGAAEIAPLRDRILNQETRARMPAAAKLVTRALETCRENLRIGTSPHLRSCIAVQHDMLSTNSTQDVWRALRPGG